MATGNRKIRDRTNLLESQLQEAQERLTAFRIIQEVANSLTSELNLEPLLHKILAAAVKLMTASAGSLILLDELTDELEFAVIEGGGGDKLKGVRMASDKGIAGWVISNRKPLIVDDVNKDNRYYQNVANSLDFKLTSLLCVPMISHSRIIGVLQLLHSVEGRYFNDLDQQLLTTFANQAAIAIENARLYETVKEERDRLITVGGEIRKHLARDLHDGPAQLLAAIVMSLSFIKEVIKRTPECAEDEIEHTVIIADKALKQLRTLLFDLRPVILETQGLIPALEVYVQRLQEVDNLNINLTVKDEFERLLPNAEIAIFAVIQEAVNNAKKHAQALCIDLILEPDQNNDRLTVFIKDNGIGFNVHAIKDGYDKRGSLGMINIQERTEAIYGTFTIHSEQGKGTEVMLILPISKNSLGKKEDI